MSNSFKFVLIFEITLNGTRVGLFEMTHGVVGVRGNGQTLCPLTIARC